MKCDVTVINRIKRAQGQMQGVITMMGQDMACIDIVNQLKAVRSTVDKAIGILTTNNLIQTIEQSNHIKLDNVSDAINLVVKGYK
ncbi:MAG: metal-sensing transcriptional repressor [Acholeplasmataceae bacterium]|nr:metal-sensing transcriptional repressor [Acholeplasmataceae bacterium]